jgi:hypothetical protein
MKGNSGTRSVDKTHTGRDSFFTESELSRFHTDINRVFPVRYDKESDDVARELARDRVGTVFAPKGEVRNVSVNRIHPCQDGINAKNTMALVESIKNEGIREPATALQVGNEIYLLDGHHRVAAAIIAKKKQVPLRIVTATEEEWEEAMRRKRRQ